MTVLGAEILKILIAEAQYPPLSTESLVKVLHYTGYSGRPERVPVAEVETVLQELLAGGQVERIWRRGVACYRAMENKQAGDANAL